MKSAGVILAAFVIVLVIAYAVYLHWQLGNVNETLAGTETTLVATQNQLVATKDDLASTEEALANTNAALAETSGVLASTTATLNETAGTLDSTNAVLTETQGALTRAQDVLANTRTALADEQAALEEQKAYTGSVEARADALAARLAELEQIIGDRDKLAAQVVTLETDIAAKLEELADLDESIRRYYPTAYTGQVSCTGSMNPTITCADTTWERSITAATDIRPGHIVVHDKPWRWGDPFYLTKPRLMHRVIATAVGGLSGRQEFYLTKGDSNFGDDGKWLTRVELHEVLLGIRRNAAPEQALMHKLESDIERKREVWQAAMRSAECHKVAYKGGHCYLSDFAITAERSFSAQSDYNVCRTRYEDLTPHEECAKHLDFTPASGEGGRYYFRASPLCAPPAGMTITAVWETVKDVCK